MQCDRCEIIQHVVRKRIECTVQHMSIRDPEADRIAVGRGPSGPADTDAALRSTHVFDDERLPKAFSHRLGHDSRGPIQATPWRKWNNYRDGARRIGLRGCDTRE